MIEFELRARDLERASRTDPSMLDRQELLGLMVDETWSVRMHLCRMLARMKWPADEYRQILEFLFAQAVDKNAFVRAWALDALASFARTDEAIRPMVLEMISLALESGPPSVRVRAREGLRRMER
ncbi:MAG: HEAT repeat domain-containing protein [Fimbriimonadales bacterium]